MSFSTGLCAFVQSYVKIFVYIGALDFGLMFSRCTNEDLALDQEGRV